MASDPEKRTSGERSPTAGGGDAPVGGRDSIRPSATAGRAPQEVLRAFLYGFVAYVKVRKLYPPGHERLTKQLESWLEATEAVFAHQEEVSLFVQPDAIFVSGQKFGAEDHIASDFAPELVKRLVRYVTIERGITAEELAALAEPLLLEPEELLQAGGVRSLLAGSATSWTEAGHVFIIEFSYDMGTYVTSEEDVEVVRTLARYESGAQPEEYVLRRFGEFGVSAEEKQRLGQLLRNPEVGSRLRSLAQLLGGFAPGGEAEVHTSDLVLYVVRSLTQVEQELNQEVTQESSARVFSHLVDRVQERLMVVLANPREVGPGGTPEGHLQSGRDRPPTHPLRRGRASRPGGLRGRAQRGTGSACRARRGPPGRRGRACPPVRRTAAGAW